MTTPCTTIELAAILRQSGGCGSRIGNWILDRGLVRVPERVDNWRHTYVRWWDEKNAHLATVNFTELLNLCTSPKFRMTRLMGIKSRDLLWNALRVQIPQKPRCPCCDQVITKRVAAKLAQSTK